MAGFRGGKRPRPTGSDSFHSTAEAIDLSLPGGPGIMRLMTEEVRRVSREILWAQTPIFARLVDERGVPEGWSADVAQP